MRRSSAAARLLAHIAATASVAGAEIVPVSNAAQLVAAIDAASPGDVVTLAPGTYTLSQNLNCDSGGTPNDAVTVRAETAGTALVRFSGFPTEGFKVSAPYWTFEGLVVEGVCPAHSDCEHAFHIFGNADFTVLRDNRLRDFNAQIKGNGVGGLFPDDVLLVGNELYDTAARNTSNPTTKIDVVGGRRWVVRGNFIHDFQKGQSDFVSYAAFLKGHSRDGLFERNLVRCEMLHSGGVRLGLSFGGGGSGAAFCEDPDPGPTCPIEHQDGTMRRNVILDCPDVGIYLNESAGTTVHGNTLYDTAGIDVRFATSFADLRGNVMSGDISLRDGGTSVEADNLENVTLPQWNAWFAAPADADFSLTDGTAIVDQGDAGAPPEGADFCARSGFAGSAPDLGAIEYATPSPCTTSLAGGGKEIFADGWGRGGVGAWSAHVP